VSWLRASFVLLVSLAATSLELWVVYKPYWYVARDLRVTLASGPVQEGVGANLNYGMYLGSRLLQGEGLTFGPGWVPWERTPGYGFFGALAGLVAGYATDIWLVSIELHLLVFALANAAFVAAAARVMRPGAAVLTAVLVMSCRTSSRTPRPTRSWSRCTCSPPPRSDSIWIASDGEASPRSATTCWSTSRLRSGS